MTKKFLFVTIALIAALFTGFWFYSTWEPKPRSFDSKLWIACSPHEHVVRYAMLEDLLRKYKLVGMSRAELILLLGTPDNGADSWDLGSIPGNDDLDLNVQFKDDKVEKYEIYKR